VPIDWSRLRSLPARRLARALVDDGFALTRQRGSHRRYAHPDWRRVTLSFHSSGETFRVGTLRSIIEIQARWSEQDLRRLGLLEE
jgi:predicted RNA binding protein YcfA (HicA-like mRNA interferase family)